MAPRRKTARELYDVAFAQLDAARAQSRIETAESEARVAKLKLAHELEKSGRQREADKLIAEVRREQQRLDLSSAGLDTPADRPECPQCGGRGTESRSWDEPERCPGCRGTGLAPADSQPEDGPA